MSDDRFSFVRTIKLRSDDNLQLVIRAHLHVESLLYALLTQGLRRPDDLDLDRIAFMTKARLAVAMGLITDQVLAPLTGLNKLRNKFAHQQEYQFTDKDKADLLNIIPKDVQDIILSDADGKPLYTRQDVPLEQILAIFIIFIETCRKQHAEVKKEYWDAYKNLRAVLDESKERFKDE